MGWLVCNTAVCAVRGVQVVRRVGTVRSVYISASARTEAHVTRSTASVPAPPAGRDDSANSVTICFIYYLEVHR